MVLAGGARFMFAEFIRKHFLPLLSDVDMLRLASHVMQKIYYWTNAAGKCDDREGLIDEYGELHYRRNSRIAQNRVFAWLDRNIHDG